MFLESGIEEVCKKIRRAKSPSATVGSIRYDLRQVAFSALSDHTVHSFQDSKKQKRPREIEKWRKTYAKSRKKSVYLHPTYYAITPYCPCRPNAEEQPHGNPKNIIPHPITIMKPIVSIIMGSTSDLPVMEKAAKYLDEMHIPFEMNALSAHRTPGEVEEFSRNAAARGLKVIIAGAGMAAALPGVIAASTTLPVIGVPIKGMLDGLDAMLSIVQMPPGIPVATTGVNGALNAAILASEMLALADEELAKRVADYKEALKQKIVKANAELADVHYAYKCN